MTKDSNQLVTLTTEALTGAAGGRNYSQMYSHKQIVRSGFNGRQPYERYLARSGIGAELHKFQWNGERVGPGGI
jgi:hypothetical protein